MANTDVITITICCRYLALVKPLQYHRQRTRLNLYAKKGVVLIWAMSFLLSMMTALRLIPGDKFEVHPMGMTLSKQLSDLYFYHSIIIFSTLLLWIIYAKIHFALKKNVALFSRNRRKRSQKRLMVRTLRAMIISFTVCYMPLAIIQSFHEYPTLHLDKYFQFSSLGNSAWNFGMYVASRLIVLNSFLNCVIYNYKNKYLVLENQKMKARLFGRSLSSIRKNNSECIGMEELNQTTQITQRTNI